MGNLILFFFFLSGFCGLVYEVVWTKMLTLVMGNTVFSTTTVVACFMGGLALGSYIAGRFIDKRKDPLRIYGILEGLIGIYCLFIPSLIKLTEPILGFLYRNYYSSFYIFSIFRFFICAFILIVPTTFMGATLPLLSKFFADRYEKLGWTLGKLYSINTFGAVAGCFGAGFIIIPTLGIKMTIYSAVIINLIIAVSTIIFYQSLLNQSMKQVNSPHPPLFKRGNGELLGITHRKHDKRENADIKSAATNAQQNIILICFGLSGFAAMVYQILWIRMIALSIGSSVYAFSLIVTAFILGIASGSIIFAKFSDKTKNLNASIHIIEILIALSALLSFFVLSKLPIYIVDFVIKYSYSFILIHIVEFSIIFLILLIPTIMMGALFPLFCKLYTKEISNIGKHVGNIYASNTFGSILGSFFAGFVFIPLIGIKNSILLAVLINTLIAITVFYINDLIPLIKRFLISSFVFIIITIAVYKIPNPNIAVLTSGSYFYAKEFKNRSTITGLTIENIMEDIGSIIYYNDGITATVTVREYGDNLRSMQINGKTDASSQVDMPTQILEAHIPMMLHKEPKDVLIIGLGSGMTLGSVERYPVKSIDCVEISDEVVKASHFFKNVNHDALNDKRVNMIVADGRNHIMMTDKKYDVILSTLTNVWISGIGNLFTKEYFELTKNKLNKDGIVGIWIHAYKLSDRDFKMVIKTVLKVFPYVQMWEFIAGRDYFLICSTKGIKIDYSQLESKFKNTDIKSDLKRLNITHPIQILGRFLMATKGLKKYTEGIPVNTDNKNILEFSASKSFYKETWITQLINLYKNKKEIFPLSINLHDHKEEVENRLKKLHTARIYTIEGLILGQKKNRKEAMKKFETAISISPDCVSSLKYLEELSNVAFLNGETWLQKSINLKPDEHKLETTYLDTALKEFNIVSRFSSLYSQAKFKMGYIYQKKGLFEVARKEYEKAIEINPKNEDALINLANLYDDTGDHKGALNLYYKALEINPKNVMAHLNFGISLGRRGQYEEAKKEFEEVLKIDPKNESAKRYLEKIKNR